MDGCQEGILLDIGNMSQDDAGSRKHSDQLLSLNSDTDWITNEVFDFNLPTTPESTSDSAVEEDESEVFFGPVSFKERCVKSVISSASKENRPVSPPTEQEMEVVYRDANHVARKLSSRSHRSKAARSLLGEAHLESDSNRGYSDKDRIIGHVAKMPGGHLYEVSGEDSFDENKVGNKNTQRPKRKKKKPENLLIDIDDSMEDDVDMMSEPEIDYAAPVSEEKVDDATTGSVLEAHSLANMETDSSTLDAVISTDVDITVEVGSHVMSPPQQTRDSHPNGVETSQTCRESRVDGSENLLVNINGSSEAMEESASRNSPHSDHSNHKSASTRKDTKFGAQNKTAFDNVSSDKCRSDPVKGDTDSTKSFTRADPNRRSISRLKQPSKLKPSSDRQTDQVPAVSDSKTTASKEVPRSKLAVAKCSSLLPSKMKPVGPSLLHPAGGNMPSKLAPAQSTKSALPGPKTQAAPVSKLQMMRPSKLQRPAVMSVKNPSSEQKKGPMKAFAANLDVDNDDGGRMVTPLKVDKSVKPKNLSSSFSTPSKNGPVESPVSSVQKRRSCLPTPTKSRLSSVGSLPSPSGSRTSSTSSTRSLESPLIRAPHSSSKYPKYDHLDDSSPSAMKGKRPLVTNTPNMPRKASSRWSPVQKKKPIDLVDQAIMCTKKTKY